MIKIKLTTEKWLKNPNTKTTYLLESVETTEIDETQYNNIVSKDTIEFFKRLGGSETKQMSYSVKGYTCSKLTSVSPNKQNKTVRKFKFEYV